MRGGGPIGRVDAFRVQVPGTWLAVIAIAALGGFALIAAAFDPGQPRQTGDVFWLVPSGIILLATAAGLGWFALRRPVVLTVGPEGLHMPVAWAAPLAWRNIWRMRCVRRRVRFWSRTATLEVDLPPEAMVPYKRWARSVPVVDRWMVRKFGLRVPLQHLDADVGTVLASVERYRPVSVVSG
jgi:hypothetical protein